MMRPLMLLTLTAFLSAGESVAADVNAGKSVANAKCLECHEAGDWEGEDAASLSSLIRDIVAGHVKHKRPLQLSEAEIQNIAAYWASGDKK